MKTSNMKNLDSSRVGTAPAVAAPVVSADIQPLPLRKNYRKAAARRL
jgi:hypothetical protein